MSAWNFGAVAIKPAGKAVRAFITKCLTRRHFEAIGGKFVQRLLLNLLKLAFGAALIVAPSLTNIGSGSMYDSAFADKGGNGKGGGSGGGNGNGGNGNGGGNNGGNSNGGGNAGNGNERNSSGFSKGTGKAKHAKAPKKHKAALNAGHAPAPAITAAQRLLTDAQAKLNAALADPKFDLTTFLTLEQAVAKAHTAYARSMSNATVANQAAEYARSPSGWSGNGPQMVGSKTSKRPGTAYPSRTFSLQRGIASRQPDQR
jgi:hypothetical protein